jgi:hypothetical protein
MIDPASVDDELISAGVWRRTTTNGEVPIEEGGIRLTRTFLDGRGRVARRARAFVPVYLAEGATVLPLPRFDQPQADYVRAANELVEAVHAGGLHRAGRPDLSQLDHHISAWRASRSNG